MNANPLTRPSPDDGPTEPSTLGGLTVAAGLPAASSADPLPGRTLDGITITRLVAEGGMGRVYEGIQERPRRVVAVKVMRPGLATATMIRRFEREGDVLARLRHAGIAHVHAVGTHPSADGPVPYLVMEFVPDAKTILAYAEALRLSVRHRLELFHIVCEAVAHAHRAGIVHRDLKPGNILVDGDGQPKVIDFGVARAIAEATGATLHTETGQILGTLQYMSPEQFAGDPIDVDARSDVYALGVVLCELLTGGPPYDLRRKSVVEAARIIMDDAAAPPVSLGRLKGDPAVIVGKCLEKDPRRRYADAGELAADIGRHLAAEPITARPPTLLDVLRRRARRHRVAVAAAASFVAALILAMAGMRAIGPPADVGQDSPKRGPDALPGNEPPAAVGIDETARAIYDKAIAAVRALRSLECTSRTTIDGPQGAMGLGSPGTNVRARVVIRFAPADASGPAARGTLNDSIRIERLDGEDKGLVTVLHKGRMWQIDAAKKTIAEAGLKEGSMAFVDDLIALPGWFGAVRYGEVAGPIISCRRSGTETIDGLLCDVLEIVRGAEGTGFPRINDTFAVARRDGLPRRYSTVVELPAGAPQEFAASTTSITTITDVVTDRPIDDAMFESERSEDLKKVEPPKPRLPEGMFPDVSPAGPEIKESS